MIRLCKLHTGTGEIGRAGARESPGEGQARPRVERHHRVQGHAAVPERAIPGLTGTVAEIPSTRV